jgi:hypothetical protein
VTAHAQKLYFIYRRNGRVHLNQRGGGRQFSRLLTAEVCAISGSNAGYTMFRGNVKSTGYPLRSQVSPSLPLPCELCAIIFQLEYTPSAATFELRKYSAMPRKVRLKMEVNFFFGRARDLYLCLYNQQFTILHHVFKFLTP